MPTLWYASDVLVAKKKRGRPRKDANNMTPSTNETATAKAPEAKTKQVQKTVFDLSQFDDVKLVKTVTLPAPVTSVQEALAAVGNEESKLLAVINAGLEEHFVESARNENNGWFADEDGEVAKEPYTGKYAEGDFSKTVNAAILNFAKMLSMGSGGWDGLTADKKREYKALALKNFRENPAVLASITGQPAPAQSA